MSEKKEEQDKIEYVSEEDLDGAEKKVKKIKEKLKICEKERSEYLAGWQRVKADYLNLQKEYEKKIADYLKYANEDLILELLPVLDSFEAAVRNSNDDGVKRIYEQLLVILKNNGIKEIKAVGERFDPKFHESVEVVDGEESGKVFEIVQKGYTLYDKVIRPAKVKVIK